MLFPTTVFTRAGVIGNPGLLVINPRLRGDKSGFPLEFTLMKLVLAKAGNGGRE